MRKDVVCLTKLSQTDTTILYFDPNAEGCRVFNRTLVRSITDRKHMEHKTDRSETRTSVYSINCYS